MSSETGDAIKIVLFSICIVAGIIGVVLRVMESRKENKK